MEDTKTCRKCGAIKMLAGFPFDRRIAGGRSNECRACYNTRHRVWGQQNQDRIRLSDKRSREKNGDAIRARDRLKYRADPAKFKAKNKAYKKRHPWVKREYEWRVKYGITRTDYDRLLAQQGGGCALCGVTPTEQKGVPATHGKTLYVDHDHVTGKVRGLLCNQHNRAIGLFGDDPDLMEKAAAYLRGEQVPAKLKAA